MKKLTGKQTMAGADPMGGPLRKKADTPAGYMQTMSARSVPVAAGQNPKAAMHDGPYGGKVKA